MMDERDLDGQLGELFKRNAPFVNGADAEEQVRRQLPLRRRSSRRSRAVRSAAIAFASIALTSSAAWGAYELVDHLHQEPALVITDPTVMPGTTVPSGVRVPDTVAAVGGTSAIEGLLPVAGTAALEQVKSEGAGAVSDDPGFTTWVTGQVRLFSLQMSQAEVSGALEVTSDLSVRHDGRTDVRSSWVLTNDKGSWECGSGSGYITRDGTEEFGFGTAAGTGGYEGRTLCLQWHIKRGRGSAVDFGGAGPIPVSGWIQPAEREAGSVGDGRTPFVAAVAGGFEGGVCRIDTGDPLQTFNRRGHFEVETSDPRVAGEVDAKVDRSLYPNPGASFEVRGKWTLTNSGGVWACDTYTDVCEGENYFVFIEASGAGGYAGLKLYGQCHSVADWVSILSDADRHEFIMSGWIEGGVPERTVTSSAGATNTTVAAGEATTITGTREEVGRWQDTNFPGIPASYVDSKTGEMVLTRYHGAYKLHGDLQGACEAVYEIRFPKGYVGSGAGVFTCEGQATFVGEFRGNSVRWVADMKSSGYYDPADESTGHSISVYSITTSTGEPPGLRGEITFVDETGDDPITYSGELTW